MQSTVTPTVAVPAWRRTVGRCRAGISLVWASITLIAMILFVGLALDTAYVFLTAHQLQNAADAAALAGAAQVQTDEVAAVTEAVNIAAANKAAGEVVELDSAVDVIIGHYDRDTTTFTAGGTPSNAVRVVARRTSDSPGGSLNLLFAPIASIFNSSADLSTANVARSAVATAAGELGAGIIALDPSREAAFSTNGNVTIEIKGGSVQVNSSHSSAAASVKGSAGSIVADLLRINGGISVSGNPTLPAKVQTNTSAVADPLASLPSPLKSNYTNRGSLSVANKATVNAQPGYYPGGIENKGGTLNMAPGVYLIGPPGLTGNKGTINAPGVMLYFTSNVAGTSYGRLDITGSLAINITPPTSGTWAGVSMFADRNAPYPSSSSNQHSLTGNSGTSVKGTLYFPSTPFGMQGTSDFFANQIIAATISVSGNGKLIVDYDGRNKIKLNNVFLVEPTVYE